MTAVPVDIPAAMKALQISEQKGIEAIKEVTLSVPAIKDGQILVRVAYAGVNFIDSYFASGLYPVSLPFTLGQESAGVVVASKAEGFAVGDKVATYSGGSYAEYQAVDSAKAIVLPADLSLRDAAGLITQGLTALTMLRESYAVKKGDVIVVTAAAGGTGLNLCQIASHLGATVIGTTSTLDKAELARKNGAEVVVIGGQPGALKTEVDKVTDGKGVAAIFDGVGAATWDEGWTVLARKGTFVTFGNASGPPPPIAPGKLTPGSWKLTRPTLNNAVATADEFHAYATELFDLVRRGVVRLLVHAEAEFSEAGLKGALGELTSRKTVGKLVVKVAEV